MSKIKRKILENEAKLDKELDEKLRHFSDKAKYVEDKVVSNI